MYIGIPLYLDGYFWELGLNLAFAARRGSMHCTVSYKLCLGLRMYGAKGDHTEPPIDL